MTLGECWIGRIVKWPEQPGVCTRDTYGHVVGLEINPVGQPVPLVLFAGGDTPWGIHPGNLEPVE